MAPRQFNIHPPLLNSASPWATTIDDIRALYNSPHTGALTMRTALLTDGGFPHDPAVHQYTFFSTSSGTAGDSTGSNTDETSSLNTLGYSPVPLRQYLSWLVAAARGEVKDLRLTVGKPVVVSVTGSVAEVVQCYELIVESEREAAAATKAVNCTSSSSDGSGSGKDAGLTLLMEINLSCPNIPDKPPPAYDADMLAEYLDALAEAQIQHRSRVSVSASGEDEDGMGDVLCGIKTPPYTHQGQFDALLAALARPLARHGHCPIAFITATNTLGSCLILRESPATLAPVLNSASGGGIGGMAGSALHPLALGNVATIRKLLDTQEADSLKHIAVIGVGGVGDAAGFRRMRAVGAAAVGVGTALGREGVGVFGKILG